jgi:hypothetical protein
MLRGQGSVHIRAAPARRHFTVEDKAKVHFEDIALIDGSQDIMNNM